MSYRGISTCLFAAAHNLTPNAAIAAASVCLYVWYCTYLAGCILVKIPSTLLRPSSFILVCVQALFCEVCEQFSPGFANSARVNLTNVNLAMLRLFLEHILYICAVSRAVFIENLEDHVCVSCAARSCLDGGGGFIVQIHRQAALNPTHNWCFTSILSVNRFQILRPYSVFCHLRRYRGRGLVRPPFGVSKRSVVDLRGNDQQIVLAEYSRLVVLCLVLGQYLTQSWQVKG